MNPRVSRTTSLALKLYAAAIGAAATVVAQRGVQAGWKLVMGTTPPNPNDPEVPVKQAASWALASTIGLSVAQLAANRLIARRYVAQTGALPHQRKRRAARG